MFTMFEAEFGGIKIPKIRVRSIRQSPTEENEFYVLLWDENEIGKKTDISKGSCRITRMVKVPASCPHCNQELPPGFARFENLVDMDPYLYSGVTVKGIQVIPDTDYDGYKVGNLVELRLHYEEVKREQLA